MSRYFIALSLIISIFLTSTQTIAGRHSKANNITDARIAIQKHNNRVFDDPHEPKPRKVKVSTRHYYSSPAINFGLFLLTLGVCFDISYAMTCQGEVCIDNPHGVSKVCNPQPRHQGSKKFSPLFHNVPHPGTVTAKSKIRNRGDVQAGLQKIGGKLLDEKSIWKGMTKDEVDKVARPYWHALYKTCELDAAMGNDDPVDRTNYDHGIKRFEDLVLSKGFRNLTPDEFLDTFFQVHHSLTTGEMEGQSSFRDGPLIIQTSNIRLFKPDEAMIGIAESETAIEDAKGYLSIFKDLIQHSSPVDLIKRETWEQKAYLILLLQPEHPGYKFLNKHYSVKRALNPERTKVALKKTYKHALKKAESDPIDAAAYLHMRLIDIHGFGDGNGREARLFAFGLLSDYGYTPPVILHNLKYTAAVQLAYEKNNHAYFADFLREAICETEEKVESPEGQRNWKFFLEDLSKCEPGECEQVCEAHMKILEIERNLEHIVR